MQPPERPTLTPVARGGLTDRVIDQLRTRIADGVWPLNERLPVETALAKELGVGRSTVREAIRVLVHAGLLESRQGDGTYVRSRREIDAALRRRVLSADLLNAYEVRRSLEIEAARLAAQNRSDDDVARLRELAKERDAAASTGPTSLRNADTALRDHILACTGNPLLIDLYHGLVGPLRTTNLSLLDDSELVRDDPDKPETPELVQAIIDQDVRAAAEAADRRMSAAIRVLTVLLQALPVRRGRTR